MEISERKNYSDRRFLEFRHHLTQAEQISASKACVYATGSFGRQEATPDSDLDLCIVSGIKSDDEGKNENDNPLSNLDTICLKAELIQLTNTCNLPSFDGDGRYLKNYTINDLTRSIGTPQDDSNNTFTARLLLLLESKPLVGTEVYNKSIADVIASYWRDYEHHKNDFLPAYFANDILRLWRTFCVNYEARRKSDSKEKSIDGRIKNFKLKHSRIITCYSALLYLLSKHTLQNTVLPKDAIDMISMTPIERIKWLSTQPHLSKHKLCFDDIILNYEIFLKTISKDKDELRYDFSDDEKHRTIKEEAVKFGDSIFYALNSIGENKPFHRLIVV